MTLIKDLLNYLHEIAPISYAEDYDNVGLLVGDSGAIVNGVLFSLDCTEDIIKEAIKLRCNVIVSHHPIIFKGLKKITGASYIERVVIQAIKNDIAIVAIHTNLDNVAHGVNKKICDKLELQSTRILSPKSDTLNKLTTYAPSDYVEEICTALHNSGAGNIGKYSSCSFRVDGLGTYTPGDGANPFNGQINQKSYEKETRMEFIFPAFMQNEIIGTLKKVHPYEEVAYYVNDLENINQDIGAGMVGTLATPLPLYDFLDFLKEKMELDYLKHTQAPVSVISKVAVCGGAGSFLIKQAIKEGADIYITSDLKYHEYFESENKLALVDIGHFESEKFTIELLFHLISNKFSNFALHCTKISTNPVKFY
jgi:dinuclear metal center YbgI/SA1388 family protein